MISEFTFAVEDVFAFSDGLIVFVGRPSREPGPKVLVPCDADVVVEDHVVGRVHLSAERGAGHRAGLRAVETRSPLDVAAIRGRRCVLVHRERKG